MKKVNKIKISEICKENGYSDETIANIKYLKSQHPSLEEVLEKYRYIQPEGRLFSERSLAIIISLYHIESMLDVQKDIISDIEGNLKKFIKLSLQTDGSMDDYLLDNDVF